MCALPFGCQPWDPDKLPNYDAVIAPPLRAILQRIATQSPADGITLSCDTRSSHHEMFASLTPENAKYFAGHYRGEAFHCLKPYEVRIVGEPHVGHPPGSVQLEMEQFAGRLRSAMQKADLYWKAHSGPITPEIKLLAVLRIVTAIFVYFLEIHPYANGNGHAGRLILQTLLFPYTRFLKTFPVHPRPPHPAYGDMISEHRKGNCEPLERYLLSCMERPAIVATP